MDSLLSKNQIKFIRALKQKKYRYKYKKYLAEGMKTVSDLLISDPGRIEYIVAVAGSEIPATFRNRELYFLEGKEFDKLSAMVKNQGIMAVCHIPDTFFLPPEARAGFVLYMDRIQDPGNLGTMIRAASFRGVRNIWLSPGTVDPYSPKVVQAAMGSLSFTDLRTCSEEQLLSADLPILVADLDGENAYRFSWPERGVLVMGNEGNGPSQALREAAHHILTLPPGPGNLTDSLNVSMACISLLTLRSGDLQDFEQ